MGKVIDSLVQASIDSKNFTGVVLAKMEFTPIHRFCSAYQNIYWDEGLPSPDSGEQEYLGLGNLVGMSVLQESSELQAQTIQLTLSGIPNSYITDAFSNEYVGKPVYLWYATLDTDTYAVEGGSTGPVLIFAGSMDYINIEFGTTCTLTLNCTSRLSDWERSRGGRFNQAYQQRHVDATDIGFEYVQGIQNLAVSWGGVTIADPGGGYGGGRGGGGCFVKDTLITMSDRSQKKIQDIEVGDKILSYNFNTNEVEEDTVEQLSSPIVSNIIKYHTSEGIILTTPDHPIHTNAGWSSLYPDATKDNFGLKVGEIRIGNEVSYLNGTNILKTPIISIEESQTITQTYNLYEVVKNNNFFANNILVHNKQSYYD